MTAEILAWAGRQLTLADWEAIPEDEQVRLELVEGVLSIMQRPPSSHQRAVVRLTMRLDEQLPPELTSMARMEVIVTNRPLTLRIPDLIVTREAVIEKNVPRIDAAGVLLAVEILSDGTRKVDRILKFAEYAEAGIAQYWITDLHEPTALRAFALVGDSYELSASSPGPSRSTSRGMPSPSTRAASPDAEEATCWELASSHREIGATLGGRPPGAPVAPVDPGSVPDRQEPP